jgi:hypothetical protein
MLSPHGIDAQVAQPPRPVAGRVDLSEEDLLEQSPRPVRPRVAPARQHPDVVGEVLREAAAQVLAHAGQEAPAHPVDELDVVVDGDRAVRLGLQELALLEVVQGADDRAAGHARQRLHVPERVALRERGEDPDVEERRAEAAAGEREPHLADVGAAQVAAVRPEQLADELLQLRERRLFLVAPDALRALDARRRSHAPRTAAGATVQRAGCCLWFDTAPRPYADAAGDRKPVSAGRRPDDTRNRCSASRYHLVCSASWKPQGA